MLLQIDLENVFFCVFNFIYLFMIYREREREREKERMRQAETQAEGEAGSMKGARPSQVSRIRPWAEGCAKLLSHLGFPSWQLLSLPR